MTFLDHGQLLKACGERLTSEDVELLDTCARMTNPNVLMEVGSAGGCSTVVLGKVAKDFGAILYCVEPKPEERWYRNVQPYMDHIILVQGFSPWCFANPSVQIRWPVNFLLLDGNHKTRWVLADYHFLFPFVAFNGIIVFHDWNQAHPNTDGADVLRAVEIILETDSDSLEFVMVAPGKNNRGSIAFRKTGIQM